MCYYRNLYTTAATVAGEEAQKKGSTPLKTPKRDSSAVAGQDNKFARRAADPIKLFRSFFSARFTLTFGHDADICYVAYHFPYTFSYLSVRFAG